MKSKFSDTDPKKDPGYIFYTKNGEITNLAEVDKYEDELYEACKEKASQIVDELGKDKNFDSLFKGNLSKINDISLEKRFEEKLHSIFGELSKKV